VVTAVTASAAELVNRGATGWHVEPGTYTLRIGHNMRDLPLALTITL
jgi:hypothetical protein